MRGLISTRSSTPLWLLGLVVLSYALIAASLLTPAELLYAAWRTPFLGLLLLNAALTFLLVAKFKVRWWVVGIQWPMIAMGLWYFFQLLTHCGRLSGHCFW